MCSCRSAACTRCRWHWPRPPNGLVPRSGTASGWIGSCSREGTRGAVTGVRLAGGEVVDADAVIANPDLPVAYRTLLPGTAAPRAARRGHYSPSALVWHVGVRGELPEGTEHHNIHFGHAWEDAFRAILRDGVRMPDPSLLVSVPSLHEPSMAPDRVPHAVRARTHPEPRRPHRLDRRPGQGTRRPVRPRSSASATRPTSWSSSSSTRSTGRRRGWSGARRSRCRTGSARPDPSGPATSSVGRRAWCSRGRAPCPASACRWCSCRGCSPLSGWRRWHR